jgi:hypothetical protein
MTFNDHRLLWRAGRNTTAYSRTSSECTQDCSTINGGDLSQTYHIGTTTGYACYLLRLRLRELKLYRGTANRLYGLAPLSALTIHWS